MGINVLSSLRRGLSDTVELPKVGAFHELYEYGMRPRYGQLVMVAGRSGAQKSGFTLFWVAKMGLPTLYFSGDMSPFTAGVRMASIATGYTSEQIEENLKFGGALADPIESAVSREVGHVEFVFANPITVERVKAELSLFVLLRNELPKVVVFDNLMDFDQASDDYQMQMTTMQSVAMMTREMGFTTIVVHHASDKTQRAENNPNLPPSRREIKNGLAEKPELVLTVALGEPIRGREQEFNVAIVKQRDGPNDPTAQSFATLFCDPSRTEFWDRADKRRVEES